MAITAKTLRGATVTMSGTGVLTSCNLYSLQFPSQSNERIEVTSLQTSGNMKEYIAPDFIDGGQCSFETDFLGALPGTVTGAVLYAGTSIAKTWTFDASIASDTPASIGPNGVAKRTITLNVNGQITVA